MPTVNTYGQRKVGTAALPGARLSAAETLESTGAEYEQTKGSVAQAKGQAAQRSALAWAGTAETVGKVAQQGMAIEIDKVKRATEQAHQKKQMEAQNVFLRGLNSSVVKATSVQGEAAGPASDAANAENQALRDQIISTLPNDIDKAAFAAYANNASIQAEAQMLRHTAAETQQAVAADLEASIALNVSAGQLAASDPRNIAGLSHAVGTSMTTAMQNIDKVAPTLGWTPKQIEKAKLDTQSAMHTGVVEQLLATNQIDRAKDWYEEAHAAGQLTGQANLSLLKAIDAGSERKQGQEAFDKIIAEHDTYDDRIKAARALDDPKVRDDAEARVNQEKAIDDRRQRELESKTLNNAYLRVEKGGSIDDIPPHELALIAPHLPALRSEQIRIAQGMPRKTDYNVWTYLMEKARTDPQAFTQEDLQQHRWKLSDEKFEQLQNLKNSISGGQVKQATKQVADYATKKEVLNAQLISYGMDPDAKSDTAQGKANAAIMELLDMEVGVRQAKSGKEATNDEVRAILNTIITTEVQKTSSTGFFGLIGGNVSSEKVREFTYEDIPPDQVTVLRDRANKVGINPTNEWLVRAYQQNVLFEGKR